MKIVLDTNCLIPILVPDSYGYDIWQAFRHGLYTRDFPKVDVRTLAEFLDIVKAL